MYIIRKTARTFTFKFQKIITRTAYSYYNLKFRFRQDIESNLALLDRNLSYIYFLKLFNSGPQWLKNHRKYFAKGGFGFGEDAFHAAWLYIFSNNKITNALEIGVYRGQVISLWQLISNQLEQKISITGVSPLTSEGDGVSKYLEIDYESDIFRNFEYFDLTSPQLVKESSTSTAAKKVIEHGEWDLIYVDGSHDFEIVFSDYRSSIAGLKTGGILVMDDSSLYTNFRLSFAGHPGPSRVLKEFSSDQLIQILSVGHNNFFRKI